VGYLKYYDMEKGTYPLHLDTIYQTPKEADIIVRKLIRHFNLKKQIRATYYNLRDGYGKAGIGYIQLPRKNISLSLICHEIGHHVALQKTKQWNHNHKTWMKMRQVYRYAERFIPTASVVTAREQGFISCDNCKNLCHRNICDINDEVIPNIKEGVCDNYERDIYESVTTLKI